MHIYTSMHNHREIKNVESFAICAFMPVISMVMHPVIAKSNPIKLVTRLLAFKRAKSLDNGISLPWAGQI